MSTCNEHWIVSSSQELYIRRKDGEVLLKDEAEKVTRCLEAAISRRVSEVLYYFKKRGEILHLISDLLHLITNRCAGLHS
jgi:hypothetical protein